ncbi:MAG: ferric reductase-like transmembrane domain-containing protein [Peptococcaceae bacterium]|nr:ferric reductase-like transmembrane domain-containing protein [Peptococcaceae bacterium]
MDISIYFFVPSCTYKICTQLTIAIDVLLIFVYYYGQDHEDINPDNRKEVLPMRKGCAVLSFFAAFTILCWLATPPLVEVSFLYQLSQLLAALALVGFACANFITTRHPLIDNLFNGLDKGYLAHKWLSVSSVVLVITHLITINLSRHAEQGTTRGMTQDLSGASEAENIFTHIGIPSLILFVVLVLIALFAKKLNYQRWKSAHKFMLVPYAVGLVHYYGSSVYGTFNFTTFSVWLNIFNSVGVLSALYSIFLYEKIAFPFRYKVSSLRSVSKDSLEITGTATGKGLSCQPGQFVFLKIPGKSSRIPGTTTSFPSHPFTVSNTPQSGTHKGTLQFTIKNLGDHTAALIKTLQIDTPFAVSTPHGRFDYTRGSRHQIWIAGGIGITPFRSFYLTDIPKDYSIDCFYAYHGEAEGVYLEEMRTLEKDNLRLHLIDDTEQGFLTVDTIKDRISGEEPVDIYFCGPHPMRENLRKNLRNSGIRVLGFHFEAFQFGR